MCMQTHMIALDLLVLASDIILSSKETLPLSLIDLRGVRVIYTYTMLNKQYNNNNNNNNNIFYTSNDLDS